MFQRKATPTNLAVNISGGSSETSVVSVKTELLQHNNNQSNNNSDGFGGLPPSKKVRHDSSTNDWGDGESPPPTAAAGQYGSQGFSFISPTGSLDDPYSPDLGKQYIQIFSCKYMHRNFHETC